MSLFHDPLVTDLFRSVVTFIYGFREINTVKLYPVGKKVDSKFTQIFKGKF